MPVTTAMNDSSDSVLHLLAAERARFLGFVEKRVGSRAAAEEILQDCFLKALRSAGEIRDEERAVAWFHRVLRNAIADWYGRRAGQRAREAGDGPLQGLPAEADPEAEAELCRCVLGLAQSLKPEYAEALRVVDVEEREVGALASAAGISPGNARVRLHRAREALRRQVELTCRTCADHGCVDCTCRHGKDAREADSV